MTDRVYALVGCPGSGKSYIAEKIKKYFTHLPHDDYIDNTPNKYLTAILNASAISTKPLLIEIPFSLRSYKVPLEHAGLQVSLLVIQEMEIIIASRYYERNKHGIPKGHLKRQKTFLERAKEHGLKILANPVSKWYGNPNGCIGTSTEILRWVTRNFGTEQTLPSGDTNE